MARGFGALAAIARDTKVATGHQGTRLALSKWSRSLHCTAYSSGNHTRGPEPRRAKAQTSLYPHTSCSPSDTRTATPGKTNSLLSTTEPWTDVGSPQEIGFRCPTAFTSPYASLDHQLCAKHVHENGNSMRTHEQENRRRHVVQSVDVEVAQRKKQRCRTQTEGSTSTTRPQPPTVCSSTSESTSARLKSCPTACERRTG